MTKDEKQHKQKVASLGCALCWHLHGEHEPAEVQLHHIRTGGWGKGDYRTLIPLCYAHHLGNEGIHGMGTKAFEKHYGISQQRLLNWTLNRVNGDFL